MPPRASWRRLLCFCSVFVSLFKNFIPSFCLWNKYVTTKWPSMSGPKMDFYIFHALLLCWISSVWLGTKRLSGWVKKRTSFMVNVGMLWELHCSDLSIFLKPVTTHFLLGKRWAKGGSTINGSKNWVKCCTARAWKRQQTQCLNVSVED